MDYTSIEKEETIKEVLKRVRPGQAIDYKEFKELYEPYKYKMSEVEFAEILEISYPNFSLIKNKGRSRAKILKEMAATITEERKKIDGIKYLIAQESRYYTKEELERISEKYEIDIDKIITYICCSEKEEYLEEAKKGLGKKGKLWLGNIRCSKEFADFYAEYMIRCARKTAMKLCSKYGCKNKIEDIASDALVYILEKRGDIEKNYSDNENLCRELIGKTMYTHIKFSCLRNLRKKNENTHRRFTSHKGSQEEINVFDRGIKDNTENSIQDEVVGEIKGKQENSPEEACIELLSYYIEQGYTREEVLSKTSEELGMSRKKMLKALKTYMLEKRKVIRTGNGYVLGE